MPLIKGCSRCGTTMLLPTVRDGKCFGSPQCEALYEDPDLLKKRAAEAEKPAVVRTRAAILLVLTTAAAAYVIAFPPSFAGRRWLFGSAFLVPMYFLVELLTGKSMGHAVLWYQSLREWQRALIMLAAMIVAFGAMAGFVDLYIANSPRF